MGRQGDVSCTPGKRGRDGARLGLGLGLGPACLPSRGGTRFESRQAALGPSPQKLAVMGGAAASGLALALFAGLFLARSEQHERLRFKPAQPGEPRPVRLFTEPELARYDGQEVGRRPSGFREDRGGLPPGSGWLHPRVCPEGKGRAGAGAAAAVRSNNGRSIDSSFPFWLRSLRAAFFFFSRSMLLME